jgi:uncharacterized damage-inducible protein DinB
MTEVQRILDQMDRAFAGDGWHGPSLMALLEGVSAEDASQHSIRGAHSIWELVNHIAAWHRIVHQRLNGELVELTGEIDWPPVRDANEVAWQRALESLSESRARLRGVVEGLGDDLLQEKPAGNADSRYITLHGVVQHDLYHAGQIAVLKKALLGRVASFES